MKQLLLITVALVIFSFTNKSESLDTDETSGVKVGEKAPTFELKNVDGKTYSFDNIKDANGSSPKGYIVVFTCNTCPVAQANEQRIIELHKKYSPKG